MDQRGYVNLHHGCIPFVSTPMTNAEHLQQMDDAMKTLMIQLETVLSDTEKEEILPFLQANEYGIAWETLWAILQEEGHVVPHDLLVSIQDIGSKMGLYPHS
jgi:hypothetical protein